VSRVLITAGAAGVGRAMAAAFDTAGYEVWVTDVDQSALDTVPRHWHARYANAADEADMAVVLGEIMDAGPLGALCANAGIAGPTAPVEQMDLQEWRACLAVNLDGALIAAKHAAPMMKRAGGGAMIFTASTAGQYGYPNRAPYAASKWAVIGLMKTIAMELGAYGVRANALCPGAVEGPRMEGVLSREAAAKGMTRDQVYDGYAKGTAMGRFIEARDVAEMAVFLASDAARLVSGQVIAVDGFTVNPDPKL